MIKMQLRRTGLESSTLIAREGSGVLHSDWTSDILLWIDIGLSN